MRYVFDLSGGTRRELIRRVAQEEERSTETVVAGRMVMAIAGVVDLGKRLKDKLKSLESSTASEAKSTPSKPMCVFFCGSRASFADLVPQTPLSQLGLRLAKASRAQQCRTFGVPREPQGRECGARRRTRRDGRRRDCDCSLGAFFPPRSSATILTCYTRRWEDSSHSTPSPPPPTLPSSAGSSSPALPSKAASTSSPLFVVVTASASTARSAVPPSSSVRSSLPISAASSTDLPLPAMRSSFYFLPLSGKCFETCDGEELPVDFFSPQAWSDYNISPLASALLDPEGEAKQRRRRQNRLDAQRASEGGDILEPNLAAQDVEEELDEEIEVDGEEEPESVGMSREGSKSPPASPPNGPLGPSSDEMIKSYLSTTLQRVQDVRFSLRLSSLARALTILLRSSTPRSRTATIPPNPTSTLPWSS